MLRQEESSPRAGGPEEKPLRAYSVQAALHRWMNVFTEEEEMRAPEGQVACQGHTDKGVK